MKTKFLILAFFAIAMSSQAQSGVSFFRVLTEPQTKINATPLMTPEQSDAVINAVSHTVIFVIELEDIASEKVYVRLKTDSTSTTDKYYQVINLDKTNLPAGTTIEKSGINVRITIGSFNGVAHYVAEIEVESATGIKSKKFQIVH